MTAFSLVQRLKILLIQANKPMAIGELTAGVGMDEKNRYEVQAVRRYLVAIGATSPRHGYWSYTITEEDIALAQAVMNQQ